MSCHHFSISRRFQASTSSVKPHRNGPSKDCDINIGLKWKELTFMSRDIEPQLFGWPASDAVVAIPYNNYLESVTCQ